MGEVIDFNMAYNMINEYEPTFSNEAVIKSDVNILNTPRTVTIEDIQIALSNTNGNKNEAAKLLGIHRSTLWRIIKNNNI